MLLILVSKRGFQTETDVLRTTSGGEQIFSIRKSIISSLALVPADNLHSQAVSGIFPVGDPNWIQNLWETCIRSRSEISDRSHAKKSGTTKSDWKLFAVPSSK